MRTAVVFSGALRYEQLASKFWHFYGKADYFLVTWNENPTNGYSDIMPVKQIPLDLTKFPVPLKAVIVSDYNEFVSKYRNHGESHLIYRFENIAGMMFNWSKIKDLPGIDHYDRIIIARPDLIILRDINDVPIDDVIHIEVWESSEKGGDQILVTTPKKLHVFKELYDSYIATGGTKCHPFMYAAYKSTFKEHFAELTHTIFGKYSTSIVRPDYPPEWDNRSASTELFADIDFYKQRWWDSKEKWEPFEEFTTEEEYLVALRKGIDDTMTLYRHLF